MEIICKTLFYEPFSGDKFFFCTSPFFCEMFAVVGVENIRREMRDGEPLIYIYEMKKYARVDVLILH